MGGPGRRQEEGGEKNGVFLPHSLLSAVLPVAVSPAV